MPISTPYIPEYITVHLGTPTQSAQNVTVSFTDYIKNVASSEIYPTWEPSALRSNIYAQISYALNRVYLEHYRSRGYNFDITNSTTVDQKFINGRNIFDNIDKLVDDLFNTYIRRKGFIEPLAAKYCNGTTVTCDGLSQWGSQELAQDGLNSIQILKYYYGDDIELVVNVPTADIIESYPGTPLRLGSTGDNVLFIQTILNRVSQNYSLIPKVVADGDFGVNTEKAVKAFQGIFNLTPDGIVGKATWYKLVMLYVSLKKLAELNSEGQQFLGRSLEYPDAIYLGERGEKVVILQYFISVISDFIYTVPGVAITGYFGEETKNSVIQFQMQYNLPQTGVVNGETWNVMYNVFRGIVDTVFNVEQIFPITTVPYGGEELKEGTQGPMVKVLQTYLTVISLVYTAIEPLKLDGIFGEKTKESVIQFQKQFDLPETGIVDRNVWNQIANVYKNVASEKTTRPLQFPGKTLKLNDRDLNMGRQTNE